jgi:hypothetical protein
MQAVKAGVIYFLFVAGGFHIGRIEVAVRLNIIVVAGIAHPNLPTPTPLAGSWTQWQLPRSVI